MDIIMKGDALNAWLHNVAVAWRAAFPQQAAAYRQELLRVRESLLNDNGMSGDGVNCIRTVIPSDVFFVINKKIPFFFDDPSLVARFEEYFIGDDGALTRPKKVFEIKREKE